MKPAARQLSFCLLLAAALTETSMAQRSVNAPAATVTDAVFRSRWVGPQADRAPMLGMVPTSEGIEPVQDIATMIREGLYVGSLRIRPGLGVGWDYSDRNYSGQVTDSSDDSSFYIAPSLGLEYGRLRGPWSISARGGAGYVYYLNPDYAANGTGMDRNPFDATAALNVGHTGLRHTAEIGGAAGYGNGQNVQAGGNSTQLNANANASYGYLVNEYVNAGAYASYNNLLTTYEDSDLEGSDIAQLRGGAFLEWLATGKTTFGVSAEAGRLTQTVKQQELVVVGQAPPVPGDPTGQPVTLVAVRETEVEVARQFLQVMGTASHSLTAKLLVDAGLGVGYTADENVPDENTQYTGFHPVYRASATFTPSEKTSMRAFVALEGEDIVPSYGFSMTWRPRPTTGFTLSIYQNQNFSITTSDQFQVNRGFVAGIDQTIFTRLSAGLSGGWQQTENVSLSSDQGNTDPYDYAFVSARLRWTLNSWAYWQATVMSSTGNRGNPTTTEDFPETTASVGLNLLF
jgi:hypothetical protein